MTEKIGTGIDLKFDDLADLFVKMGSSLSPAYLHGSIAGVLSAGKRMNQDDWVDWAIDLIAPSGEIEAAYVTVIQGLYFKTAAELQDEGFVFNLILPDEETPLTDRLLSLSDWVGSFLGAFGATGIIQDVSEMPATLQEILEDLSEIAQVDAESGEQLATAEEDFLAIAEHVRVSVITVFLEYNEPSDVSDDPDTLH